jgi:hypothetical protein
VDAACGAPSGEGQALELLPAQVLSAAIDRLYRSDGWGRLRGLRNPLKILFFVLDFRFLFAYALGAGEKD